MAWEAVREKGKTFHEDLTPTLNKIASEWGIDIVQKRVLITHIKWSPTDVGWVKSNSEGSLIADRACFGALLRDHLGAFLAGVAVQSPKASINLLELDGILAGITLAVQKKILPTMDQRRLLNGDILGHGERLLL
ncbi:hypothetical protein QJS10_CPA08g00714 [Acorus calamus]|uniref:RNase H type-1 domain-containing protein n=1 Tax=Acorus calamus TaxID=4465 RepID=A0AAV9E7I0_ACOCL|nr:hypothetical protein QJS10_CPA08g00714 [Acorus calamus]